MATDNRTPTPEETPPVILDGQISMFRETAATDQDDEQTPPDDLFDSLPLDDKLSEGKNAVDLFAAAESLIRLTNGMLTLLNTDVKTGQEDKSLDFSGVTEFAKSKFTLALFTIITEDGIKAMAAALEDEPEELRRLGISQLAYKRADDAFRVSLLRGVNLLNAVVTAVSLIEKGKLIPIKEEDIPSIIGETPAAAPSDKKEGTEITLQHHAKATSPLSSLTLGDVGTPYMKMLQGKGTNALATIGKKDDWQISLDGTGTLEREDIIAKIEKFSSVSLSVNTTKVFDIICVQLADLLNYGMPTEHQIKSIIDKGLSVSCDDIMHLLGRSDKKELQKELRKIADELYAVSIAFTETRTEYKGKKKTKASRNVEFRLFHKKAVSASGKITLFPSPSLIEYLATSYIMPVSKKAFLIESKKYRHAYHLHRRLYLHYNMNQGRSQANIIAVKTLLDAAPDLPKYEKVITSTGKNVQQQIIDPFERNMDALVDGGVIASWEYCNSKFAPLSDDQLGEMTYKVFSECFIHFELTDDYPHVERPKLSDAGKKKTSAKKKAAVSKP